MINRAEILAAVACLVLGGGRDLSAGGIHIRYPVDAPQKLAGANEVYAREVLNLDHQHPRWFAHAHPFYTHMFENQVMMDRLVARWEAHEQRFEYWHNSLWKILDAYAIEHEAPPSFLPTGLPSSSNGVSEARGGVPVGGNPGGGGQGIVSVAGVPEPSSGVVMVSGLIVGLMGFTWRWVPRRSPTGAGVPA